MTYEPDWTNSRTRKPLLKRLVTVLNWCQLNLNSISTTAVYAETIKEVFGHKSNPLTQWLRAKLLIRIGTYATTDHRFDRVGHPYEYKLNKAGFEELSLLVPDDNRQIYQEPVESKFAKNFKLGPEIKHKEALDTLTFVYKDKSNRLFHPLQNIKRHLKQEFWAPYLPYDYDIEASAPTLLLQYARKCGLSRQVTPGIDDYLKNKNKFREHTMKLTGLSMPDAKKLVNSLFNGARLVPHHKCAAYVMLGMDQGLLKAFKEDPQVVRLRNAITRMWLMIKSNEEINYKKNLLKGDNKWEVIHGTAQIKKAKFTSSKKWELYFRIEREVLNVMVTHMTKQGIKFFCEHDGFRTNTMINKEQIVEAVLKETGYQIQLSGPTQQQQ
jgi:hypothetical protein